MKNIKSKFLWLFAISLTCASIEQIQASQYGKMLRKSAIAVGYAFAFQQNNMSEPDQHSQDNDIDAIKYPEFAKFVKKYRCSAEIEQQVQKEDGNIKHIGNDVYEYKEIPFMNKGRSIDRIINAERMKKVIAVHKLDRIDVPDKCLCKMHENDWNVIVGKVKQKKDRLDISLVETQQLSKLMEETLYLDTHSGNLMRGTQNEIIIIDTEDRSFFRSGTAFMGVFKKQYLRPLIEENCDKGQSKEWLSDRMALDNKIDIIFWRLLYGPMSLRNNRQYDDADIDFEKVKEEFAAFNRESK